MLTLVFIGHRYKYELESICKLFFHSQKINLEYETFDFERDELIITRKRMGRNHVFLLAVVKYHDRLLRLHSRIPIEQSHDKKLCERLLCELVYRLLCQLTGMRPAWGILTSVRPVKHLHWDTEKGLTLTESMRRLEKDFLVSKDKIDLCRMIYEVQRPVIQSSQLNSVSLYISIPFCPSRCSYCSFVSHSIANKGAREMLPDYLEKLMEEIRVTADIIREIGLKLETVYVGGGTPTTLSAEQLNQLCSQIENCFDLTRIKEYTVEAGRADTITEEKLRVLKAAGVTRISINPQSFEDAVLEAVGRKHTAEQVVSCFELARKVGHNCINMDFIAGLPSDTLEGFCRTIDRAVSLDPENITVHTLTVKRSSRLFEKEAERAIPSEDHVVSKMVDYAQNQLIDHRYLPYYLYKQKNTPANLENVGYAKAGYEGLYNIYMMEEIHTILACGGGAVTKLVNPRRHAIERIFNFKYPYEYRKGFDQILERKSRISAFYAMDSLIDKQTND